MSETTYTLTVTAKQAAVISQACELLTRLSLGQWHEFIRHMPGDAFCHSIELEDELRPIMAAWFARHPIGKDEVVIMRGWQSSLGIGNPNARPEVQVAFDLHQVIRHRLAWDKAVADGITDGTKRPFPQMMTVDYDDPMRYGTEPLATMEANT